MEERGDGYCVDGRRSLQAKNGPLFQPNRIFGAALVAGIR